MNNRPARLANAPVIVRRSRDAELIRAIITHDAIWDDANDDGTPPRETFQPVIADSLYYLVPELDGAPMGVFMVAPHNSTTYEWHTAILPQYRGKYAIKACRLALEWMREHSPALKIITWVPVEARHVYSYARACGFILEGRSENALLKNGKLQDQFLMGKVLCPSP